MQRLLLVDDDTELCELVSEYLGLEGFEVEAVHDGRAGLERALADAHALAILDVMLPGSSGFDILRSLRARSSMPVLMLTARGEDVDRIVGLEMGADDYLAKPFNARELVARVRAILRRTAESRPAPRAEAPEVITVEEVTLDKGARSVRLAGALVELTAAEFDLLELFLRAAGSIVTREAVARSVLGRHFDPFDRSVDMHVSRLRRKLGPRRDGLERIKSVRGAGYIYVLPHRGATS